MRVMKGRGCVHREGTQVGLRQELDGVGVVAHARVQEVAGHAADEVLTRRASQGTQGGRRCAGAVPVRQLLRAGSFQHISLTRSVPLQRNGQLHWLGMFRANGLEHHCHNVVCAVEAQKVHFHGLRCECHQAVQAAHPDRCVVPQLAAAVPVQEVDVTRRQR